MQTNGAADRRYFVQGTPANCVSVLILGQRLRVPSYRIAILSNNPRRAAITLVVLCAVIRPTGFLEWRIENRCC